MLTCLACASDGKDGADSPAVKDGRDDMPANVIDCSAGDHDTDGDGRRDYTMECYENGNRKREIVYHPDGMTKDYEYTYYESNGNKKTRMDYTSDDTKFSETTYYESNGQRKTYLGYHPDGMTQSSEITFYESNGDRKTKINYYLDGTKHNGHPICYQDDGNTEEPCTQAKHGCDENSKTCIN